METKIKLPSVDVMEFLSKYNDPWKMMKHVK
jgi:hypothetical protein